jgi:histidine triad (HIT) family protein
MTIFERIIALEIPATILYEDAELIAFRDNQAQAPVHVLVVPKNAIPSSNDLDSEDAELIGKMVLVAKNIAKTEGIAESGYRIVINCNKDGGQSVDHLHLHLLGGRKMGWPPG